MPFSLSSILQVSWKNERERILLGVSLRSILGNNSRDETIVNNGNDVRARITWVNHNNDDGGAEGFDFTIR